MAVRFNAGTDELIRTAGLPNMTAVTVMAWFYLTSDTNNFVTLFELDAAGYAPYRFIGLNNDGVTVLLDINGASNTGTTLNTATWYHITYTKSGNTHTIWLNGISDTSVVTAEGVNIAWFVVGQDNADGNNLDGRAAYIKTWEAALTQAEIQQEMRVIRPIRTANLYGWWPTFPGAAERDNDYSGNGRDWTQNGALTDENPPSISYVAITHKITTVTAEIARIPRYGFTLFQVPGIV